MYNVPSAVPLLWSFDGQWAVSGQDRHLPVKCGVWFKLITVTTHRLADELTVGLQRRWHAYKKKIALSIRLQVLNL
jgi:hypothetical protein